MQCPSCHKEVPVEDKDIGALYTCPQCRSVYFMGFDGVPEYGEVVQPTPEELAALISQDVVAAPPVQAAPEFSIPQEIPQEMPVETSFELSPASDSIADSISDSIAEPIIEVPSDFANESVAEPVAGPIIETIIEPVVEPVVEPMYEAMSSFAEQSSSPQQFDSVADEIMKFGNQQLDVSGLSYDLEIRGIDSKEAMALLKEAIDDSKFGWVVEDYVQQIKTGTCRFKSLTPVQAFVLVKRIQFIDVEMKWTQNVLT